MASCHGLLVLAARGWTLPGCWTAIDAGAGTLLDVKRAARVRTVIDGGAWTAGLHKVWEPLRGEPARTCPVPGMTLRRREPWPEASTRAPRQKACQALCAALPHNARSHDESARASLRQRNGRNGRNSSPYLDEIPIREGCPGSPGQPPCRPPPSRAGPSYELLPYVSKMSISGRSRRTRRWP